MLFLIFLNLLNSFRFLIWHYSISIRFPLIFSNSPHTIFLYILFLFLLQIIQDLNLTKLFLIPFTVTISPLTNFFLFNHFNLFQSLIFTFLKLTVTLIQATLTILHYSHLMALSHPAISLFWWIYLIECPRIIFMSIVIPILLFYTALALKSVLRLRIIMNICLTFIFLSLFLYLFLY